MDKTVLELFSYDILQSYRATKEKIIEHPIMTIWFILLLFTGFAMVLFLIEFASTLDELFIEPSRGDVLFSIFFFLFAKSSAETVDNTFRNNRLKFLISSPISSRKVVFSRLLKEVWYNLLLVAVSMGIVTSVVHIFNIQLPIDTYFLPHLYMLSLLAPISGFFIAMLSQQKDVKRKIIGMILYGQTIPIVYWILRTMESSLHVNLAIFSIFILTLVLILVTHDNFLDAWINGVTVKTDSSFRFHEVGDFLPSFIKEPIRRVAEKEILQRWRRRESPASVGVIFFISIGLIFMYSSFGPDPDLGIGLDEFFYPTLIGMALYLGIVIQLVLPSLTLFSREGRKMWAIKTLPLGAEDVIWGKVIAIIFFSWITVLLIAIPLPIILGYSINVILFSIISAVMMILSFTGIGTWASVRFPNYDESNDGAPDIITMYSILMLCLISTFMLISVPFTLFQMDRVLGILTLILSADLALLILYLLVKRSALLYDEIQLDM